VSLIPYRRGQRIICDLARFLAGNNVRKSGSEKTTNYQAVPCIFYMDMKVKYIFPPGQVLVVKYNNLEHRLGKIEQDKSSGGDLTKTSRSVD
jgi:hypothetical protein